MRGENVLSVKRKKVLPSFTREGKFTCSACHLISKCELGTSAVSF